MPFLVAALAHVSWLDLNNGSSQAAAHFLLLLLAASLLIFFLAAGVCRRAIRERLRRGSEPWLLALLCLFTLFFGAMLVFLPGGTSQDVLLSALYGLLVSVYHVNPYLVGPTVLAHDPLYRE